MARVRRVRAGPLMAKLFRKEFNARYGCTSRLRCTVQASGRKGSPATDSDRMLKPEPAVVMRCRLAKEPDDETVDGSEPDRARDCMAIGRGFIGEDRREFGVEAADDGAEDPVFFVGV